MDSRGAPRAAPLAGTAGLSHAEGGTSTAGTGNGGRGALGGAGELGGAATGGGLETGGGGMGSVSGSAGSTGGIENPGGEGGVGESAGGTVGADGGVSGSGGVSGAAGTGGRPGAPSCSNLAAACGVDGTSDCCSSTVVPELVGTTATLFSFALDRYEVTVGRFRNFVAATDAGWRPAESSGSDPNNPQDRGWTWSLPDDIRANVTGTDPSSPGTWTNEPGDNEYRPLNYLDWTVAFAFCIWDGGRLPTVTEWSYAATGGERRVYPWSSPPESRTIDPTYAVYDCSGDGILGACAIEDLPVVGSRPKGDGRFGQSDLSGSVFEWLRDIRDPLDPSPVGTSCGGSYRDIATAVTASFCLTLEPPNGREGVRCARSP